jgi:CHAT domain-containing protein
MVLEYALDQKRSHLWTVTRTRIEHYFLPGRLEIEKTANQLGQLLTSYEQKRRPNETDLEYLARLRQPPDQYRASALKLGQMVLGQIWSQLGDKRLVIVADGALQYIPFEVLLISGSASTNQFSSESTAVSLLSRNEVVYQPSASTLALLRNVHRPIPSKSVAVFADPVFDIHNSKTSPNSVPLTGKEKLISSLRDIGDDDFTLPRLTYSLKEAEAIIAVAPPDSWMKAVGFQANRAAATSPALRQFGIVHFATHGIVNDKHPELSGIVLSLVNERGEPEEGYLTLHDIYGLDLPIRLVVLSACRTGIGKSVRGEGLIALTRGFMYAGAESVVVSLWRVDDEATAELMKRFYNHMLGADKLPPTKALRQAKLEMQAHAQERWRAPYYWAGFVLQGDWK